MRPSSLDLHVGALRDALDRVGPCLDVVGRWGAHLAFGLPAGSRLLVAGNGGSAAEAQHLTAELVGRYCDEREPLSAIALHAETSSLTAIVNDYGAREGFARQVRAHGRTGDVLLSLSTSGKSENLLYAVDAARERGLLTWALTGPRPNPLAERCDEAVTVLADEACTIQEVHLVLIHALCEAMDAALRPPSAERFTPLHRRAG